MATRSSRIKLSPMDLVKLSDELRVLIESGATEEEALHTLQESSNASESDLTALLKLYRHRKELKRRAALAVGSAPE